MPTKTFINEKFIKGLYETFLQAPPFCNLNMPPIEQVFFYIIDEKDRLGAAHKSRKDEYQLQISKKTMTHLHNVIETVLHEMVHLHYLYRGYSDHKHDPKFKRLANKVCDIYHLDRKTF
jgi:hypothetical protein